MLSLGISNDGINTAFIYAASNGYLDLVQYLYENGATDDAMRSSILNRHANIVKFMMECGSKVSNTVLENEAFQGYCNYYVGT